MPTAAEKKPAVSTTELEGQLASLLSTKAVSTGTKSLAAVFEEIAKKNGNVVTFEQAKAISPKSPSDLAYHFRQAGGKAVTSKGRVGQTCWTVVKLSNGELGYPAAVKAEIERVKAEIAKSTK